VADVVREAGADMARLASDLEAGVGREAVIKDYEAAVAEGVRSIPTVIVPETGRALVGLVDAAMYRAAVEEAAG
jgi:predicted DsbA family dithiol-disulfide isomerase